MRGRPLFLAVAVGLVLFLLAVGSETVRLTYGAGGATPPGVRAASAPGGRLVVIDRVPVARLKGTPFEVGRAHGALFRSQIRFLHKEYFRVLAVRALGEAEIERWTRAVEPFIPDHLKQEMRGIAEGSGLPYREILQVNCMIDRLQSLMCSTVVASGKATRDGEVYFGRNLDFPGRNILHKMTVVLVFEPEGKTPLASVTWPGLVGVLSGMNSRGVAGATMMIHKGRQIRPGLPYMMMYREALERARRTADVHDTIKASRRTCPNNFMVVDSTGAAEVLEWDQEVVARRPAEGGSACSTNHFRSKELEGTGWRAGLGRYRQLERFLADGRGSIDLGKIKQALEEVATPWFLNVQSMVFLPAKREIHLATGDKLPMAAQRWVRLERRVLFGE